MPNLWCTVCNKAVDAGASRGVAFAVAPLASLTMAAIPKLLRRRLGIAGIAVNGIVSLTAGYLANRYLVPRLQRVVCNGCGSPAVARA